MNCFKICKLNNLLTILLILLILPFDSYATTRIVLGPNALKYKRNFYCPLGNKYKGLTSNFGYRWKKFHEGIDFKAYPNTNIYAAHDGVVVYSTNRMRGYGNMVIIKGHGIMTIYSHNNRNLVSRGTKIKKGKLIATVGATGHVTGPHLHFEVRVPVNRKWYAVNPNFFEVCK